MNRKPCGCIGKSRQTGDGRNQFWHFFHDLSSSFSQSNCCHDPEFSDTVPASRVAGFFQCDLAVMSHTQEYYLVDPCFRIVGHARIFVLDWADGRSVIFRTESRMGACAPSRNFRSGLTGTDELEKIDIDLGRPKCQKKK